MNAVLVVTGHNIRLLLQATPALLLRTLARLLSARMTAQRPRSIDIPPPPDNSIVRVSSEFPLVAVTGGILEGALSISENVSAA